MFMVAQHTQIYKVPTATVKIDFLSFSINREFRQLHIEVIRST
jgi:hypothetical protein